MPRKAQSIKIESERWNLNRTTSNDETGVIKILPKKKISRTDGFKRAFYQTLNQPTLLKFFIKAQLQELFPAHFIGPQSYKDITRKKHFRPIALMNVDTNLKTLANQIQQHIKMIKHHDLEGFSLGMGSLFNI